MTSNSKQPKAVDYPFEVNELLKFKKIFCPCSAALPLWDKYKDHIRSSGNTSFFCFYKTLSDIVITWCALLFALEPNFSTPSLFIVDDPQYWFQVINKLNPKIAQGIYFLSSLEKIGPDTPHPCYSVLVITNFTQYTSYIKHLQHELLILFVHIDEEEIHRPLSIYHSMILPCHETIDWEEELDAIDPLYIMPSKEERRSNHPVVIYQKAKTRENEENAEAELRRLSEMATTAPANLQMTNQLEFCKFIYWKNSSVPHEEVVHTEHKISLMIINIPDLTLYQKAINNYLFHYAPTDYITKLSAHYIRTKNNLRFGFPGFRSNLTTYFKTLILIILPNTCHIRWAYETLSSIRKSFSFTDHTRVTQICQTLPKTIDLIDPCDSLEAKILNWAHIAFSKTMACVFSSLTLNSSSRKVSSIISETREIHDTLLTEHYATKLFKLVRPTCRTRRLITIPPFESIPRITKFKSELVTAKKNHTANIILSLESNEETSVNIPHPNPLLSKTYLVNHILVMLSYLGLFISVPPRHSSLNLEDLFPLDRMIDPAQHKWRAHYVTFTLVAHCVLVPNTKFFACPDYTSGLIYAVTPAANHVIVGSYGDDVQKIISYILPNLLEGCKYFHFTYVPTDISALVITTATSLGQRLPTSLSGCSDLIGGSSPLFIGISGLIGAGKTTFAELIGPRLGCRVLYEPVIDNVFLEDFYRDMKKYGFDLQIYLLQQRYRQHQSITWSTDSCIQDRTIYEDSIFAKMLFEQGLIEKRQYELYINLFRDLSIGMRKPCIIIHLDVTPETALARIKERSRGFETGITLDYLQKLYQGYEEFLADLSRRSSVIKIDWNTFKEIDEVVDIINTQWKPINPIFN